MTTVVPGVAPTNASSVDEAILLLQKPVVHIPVVLDPERMNSPSQFVVCAVETRTAPTTIDGNAVDPQNGVTTALRAVMLVTATKEPCARILHVEPTSAIWFANVTPPVVAVVVSLIVVLAVKPPATFMGAGDVDILCESAMLSISGKSGSKVK